MKHRAVQRTWPWLWVMCFGFALLCAPGAAANGKFPEAGQLVVDPEDPQHLVARTTFGVLTTRDGGTHWDFICEGAIGYKDIEPAVALTGTGSLVAALSEGVSASSNTACDWAKAEGNISQLYVVDVSLRDPNTPVAITFEAEQQQTRYWVRKEDGGAWEQVGVALPAGFIGLTVDVAATKPERVYLSGLIGEEQSGALVVSDDEGATWEVRAIPNAGNNSPPFIGGLHPTDPDVLFVRTANSPGRLMHTADAGLSWTEAFVGEGSLRGFAISPDGSQVLVGGEYDGVWRADVSDLAFKKVSEFLPMCLKWTTTGVFACGHIFFNGGIAIAFSGDAGENFESMLCMADVRGPLECPSGSEVEEGCAEQWADVSKTLAKAACGQSDSSSGAAATGAGGGAGAGVAPGESSSSCSCGLASRSKGELASGILLLAALGWKRRRKGTGATDLR